MVEYTTNKEFNLALQKALNSTSIKTPIVNHDDEIDASNCYICVFSYENNRYGVMMKANGKGAYRRDGLNFPSHKIEATVHWSNQGPVFSIDKTY